MELGITVFSKISQAETNSVCFPLTCGMFIE